ncbi:cell division protein FtsX [Sphingomonas xanthus]|uniref:FtsX-like permease family protein n=1 Tax=Sphingomonas xanthus TaxID=2594473 RepID=A0A516IRR7_9SPHN|nr:FtsX-like permease family protein [Sphingomonas xanthus]QDP19570.1 FtsX-like permease family protein [Sphingomonas xanthus]
MNFLTVSEPEKRLIPSSGVRGPVPVLIAIMTFVMVVVGAAGLALANTAGVVRSGVEHRYSIQIIDGRSSASAAVAVARGQPGVIRATAVPQQELRRTLERWLGPAAAAADLPVPTIIDVDLAPGSDAGAIGRQVEKALPNARFVAHRDSLAPMLAALNGLTMLAAGLIVLIALASAAAVVLAARGALDTHRGTIAVMHGIGATDRQVARLFVRQIAVDALVGGFAGAVVAGVIIALVMGGASLAATIVGEPPLGWADALLLAMLPILVALLATLVARSALLRALRDRL